jgi:hypothetical protein
MVKFIDIDRNNIIDIDVNDLFKYPDSLFYEIYHQLVDKNALVETCLSEDQLTTIKKFYEFSYWDKPYAIFIDQFVQICQMLKLPCYPIQELGYDQTEGLADNFDRLTLNCKEIRDSTVLYYDDKICCCRCHLTEFT